jgi:hypothetical protein
MEEENLREFNELSGVLLFTFLLPFRSARIAYHGRVMS